MMKPRVLLVDDDSGVRCGVRLWLEGDGFAVDEADSGAQAVQLYRSLHPDVVVLDYKLPDGTALDLLPRLRASVPEAPVVILTGYGSIDLAVRAIKAGAENFLTKPVEMPALATVLRRLLENQRNRRRQEAASSVRRRTPIDVFAGESPAIRALEEQARRLAGCDCPVLIEGETGTGKGVLARWLHEQGPRAAEPFVDLNCAGLRREFLETELFGHTQGAFTGASAAKKGLLEVAHKGTVFLDEIGDVDPQVQPKLLKVLEEKTFRKLGEVRDRHVDVRLIAATHRDLAMLVRDNAFRQDLFFRISVVPLRFPPLRERRQDIPILARTLHAGLCSELGRGPVELSADAVTALAEHSWPGNTRELRNTLERAILLGDGKVLRRSDLQFASLGTVAPSPQPTDLTLEELEQRHIERVLREVGGRVTAAADRLGMPRSTLYDRLRRSRLASV